MAKKRHAAEHRTMSVYPPFEIGGALGGYKTTAMNLGIRVAAQLIGDAAVEVADVFTPDEWEVIAESYEGRIIEPENLFPGEILANLVLRHHSRYKTGDKLVETGEGLPGTGPQAIVASICDRIRKLTYLRAWAVVVAAQFRYDYEVKPGDPFWELGYRRDKVLAAESKKARR